MVLSNVLRFVKLIIENLEPCYLFIGFSCFQKLFAWTFFFSSRLLRVLWIRRNLVEKLNSLCFDDHPCFFVAAFNFA